uniref:Uncharacterized protein n=1 Tax=Lactuca sativa TaxID=4236 RepID=A0A9R1WW95_LACSA|nr:hypothetical protein LSAT_V11C900456970 [Lactuca sativa]
MLTGSSETVKQSTTTTRPDLAARNPIPAMKTGPDKKPSKLYERRSSLKNFKINPLAPGFTNDKGFSGSPRNPNAPEIMSPSLLDFPSLVLSPVTPLLSDPFNRSPTNDCSPNLDVEAEENAIAEKGFYLHPSPATTPRREEDCRWLKDQLGQDYVVCRIDYINLQHKLDDHDQKFKVVCVAMSGMMVGMLVLLMVVLTFIVKLQRWVDLKKWWLQSILV